MEFTLELAFLPTFTNCGVGLPTGEVGVVFILGKLVIQRDETLARARQHFFQKGRLLLLWTLLRVQGQRVDESCRVDCCFELVFKRRCAAELALIASRRD